VVPHPRSLPAPCCHFCGKHSAMNKLAALVLSVFVSFAVAGAARAAEPKPAKPAAAKPAGKEVTLTGTLGCAKCAFKEAKACQNVLKVKEGGKEVSYTLAKNAVSEENHEAVCSGTKPATVTGTVSEEGGKKILTASAIKVE
jgi:hypothetical protein